MAVQIKVNARRPKSNRRKGYEGKVRSLAPILIALQHKGCISAGDIAQALRAVGALTTKGKPYAESVIFGMIKCGKELGYPLIARTASEAASARINKPRPPRQAKSTTLA